MVEVGSVWVKLGVKSTLGKDLGKATTQLNKFGESARKVSQTATQLGKDLTFKLAAPLALVSGVALKSAANIEQYSIAFENLFGSAKKAGDEIVYILDFAKRTPFQITGLVAADKRLAAFGINARDVLGTLGDTAAALGVPLMQSVEAFADAQTGEFERVKEFGIKALEVTNSNYQALGVGAEAAGQTALTYTDKYGKQRVELVDRNNREIVSNTLLSIWNSKYAGAMEMQSKSLAGIASNIKDNFTIAGLSIMGFNQQTGQFTDDSLFMSIKRVSEAARSLSERFTELSPTTQKLIVGMAGLGIAIPTIILGVGLLSGAFATGATIISGSMVPALGAIIPLATTVGLPLIALGGILYGLEKKFGLVSDTITITIEAFKVFGKVVSEKITAAFERIQPRIDSARESLENLMEGMIELSGPVGIGLKEFLNDWHQRAEDIRKKNEELSKSTNEVTVATLGAAAATDKLNKAIGETDSKIPGYAGHMRELLEAGLAGEAGFEGPDGISEKFGPQKFKGELEAERKMRLAPQELPAEEIDKKIIIKPFFEYAPILPGIDFSTLVPGKEVVDQLVQINPFLQVPAINPEYPELEPKTLTQDVIIKPNVLQFGMEPTREAEEIGMEQKPQINEGSVQAFNQKSINQPFQGLDISSVQPKDDQVNKELLTETKTGNRDNKAELELLRFEMVRNTEAIKSQPKSAGGFSGFFRSRPT